MQSYRYTTYLCACAWPGHTATGTMRPDMVQTHVGLKAMIKEVDEDFDGKISFREFLLIFRKVSADAMI